MSIEQQEHYRSSTPLPSTSASSAMENEVYIDGKLPVDGQMGYQGRYSLREQEGAMTKEKNKNVCSQLFRFIRSKLKGRERRRR